MTTIDQKLYDRIVAVTEKELEDLGYLHFGETFEGAMGTIFAKAGVPKTSEIPEDCFLAFKEGLCNSFYGGCEPEFEDEAVWKKWEATDSKHYCYVTPEEFNADKEKGEHAWKYKKRWGVFTGPGSPYRDKTIPWLVGISDPYLYKLKRVAPHLLPEYDVSEMNAEEFVNANRGKMAGINYNF